MKTVPKNGVESVAYSTWEQGVADSIPGSVNFYPKLGDSRCNRIHFSLAADHCIEGGSLGR